MLLMTIFFLLSVLSSLVLSLLSLAVIDVLFSSSGRRAASQGSRSATPAPAAFDLETLRRGAQQTVSQSL